MASFRCPQCNIAMTDDEIRAGVCPICEVKVATPKLEAAPAKEEDASPGGSEFSMTLILSTAVLFVLAFCLAPIGIIIYTYSTEERPTEKKEATAPIADNAKSPAAADKDKKKPSTPPDEDKKKKTDEVKQPQEKKKEPESKPPEVKKEEPKIVVKKPDPPIVVDPKANLFVARRGFACLPLLADDAIKIDGDLSDWKNVAPIALHAVERGREIKKPIIVPRTQKAWVAYCSKGILVAVEVVDTSGELENQPKPDKGIWPFWDNDAIEVYIDTLNTRPEGRGEPNAHQFFAFPLGVPNDDGIAGYESRILKRAWTIVPHANAGKHPMLRAGKKTPTGWTLEMLIPKESLRHGEIKAGQIFGFELQIDTGTNIYYFWANDDPRVQVSTSPGLWGEVIFGGTDAVIEVLDADKKPLKSLVAGQPIVVRVADADRNFLADKKEKIDVMLHSRSGDRKILMLEETGPNTGVFVGSIATRVDTGKREAGVLEVLPGESLVIEYVDPIRANGDRNVTQRTMLTVQAR